jgi:hypothetical protein
VEESAADGSTEAGINGVGRAHRVEAAVANINAAICAFSLGTIN